MYALAGITDNMPYSTVLCHDIVQRSGQRPFERFDDIILGRQLTGDSFGWRYITPWLLAYGPIRLRCPQWTLPLVLLQCGCWRGAETKCFIVFQRLFNDHRVGAKPMAHDALADRPQKCEQELLDIEYLLVLVTSLAATKINSCSTVDAERAEDCRVTSRAFFALLHWFGTHGRWRMLPIRLSMIPRPKLRHWRRKCQGKLF